MERNLQQQSTPQDQQKGFQKKLDDNKWQEGDSLKKEKKSEST